MQRCTKCAQRNIKNYCKFLKFWKLLLVKKLFEYKCIMLKYFEHHGTERQQNYNTRMSERNPLIVLKSENRIKKITWQYIVP
jgi:hypothetical protein